MLLAVMQAINGAVVEHSCLLNEMLFRHKLAMEGMLYSVA